VALVPTLADERPHVPGTGRWWGEWWCFDFAAADGALGGYVRLEVIPNVTVVRYSAWLVGPDRAPVAVVDDEVAVPRRAGSLELRAEGLWADHVCETALEHWSVANEAFGVALADPADAYGRFLGDRVPLGFDLEWETEGAAFDHRDHTGYGVPCLVHGDVLVADEVIAFSGYGHRDHGWGEGRWTTRWSRAAGRLGDGTHVHGETLVGGQADGHGFIRHAQLAIDGGGRLEARALAFAPTPLRTDGRVSRLSRALCELDADDGRRGTGWAEWHQL
jgi:hypothetical protein